MLVTVQLVGALLVLAPFAAHQFGTVNAGAPAYLWPNLIGSAALAVLAAIGGQWGFLCSKRHGPRWPHGASSTPGSRRLADAPRIDAGLSEMPASSGPAWQCGCVCEPGESSEGNNAPDLVEGAGSARARTSPRSLGRRKPVDLTRYAAPRRSHAERSIRCVGPKRRCDLG
jgi:hypothetical protein